MANIRKPLAAALGAAFLASSVAPLASAASNPFSAQLLSGGYDLANYEKPEGKCGEGKCGDKKKAEGSCGDKKAEASSGDESAQEVRESAGETKVGEGSCGEGKYGTEGD